jgi:hypothetical protein
MATISEPRQMEPKDVVNALWCEMYSTLRHALLTYISTEPIRVALTEQ